MATSMKDNLLLLPKPSIEKLRKARISSIENAIYLGEFEYIDDILVMLIDFAASLDDDACTDAFYQRVIETNLWWENIKLEYQEEENKEETVPEKPQE